MRHARFVPSLLWLGTLYLFTAITAPMAVAPKLPPNPTPAEFRRMVYTFELWHFAAHALAFAIGAALLFYAMTATQSPKAIIWAVFVPIMLVGLGLEILQALIRLNIDLQNAAVDLIADGFGTGVALWWLSTRRIIGHEEV
jgi:hypothetical protein